MAAAASWVFDTGVQDHRADVLECPPAELAGEIAGNVAVERLMVALVRIVDARVQKKSPQARVLLPTMYAVERAAGVALEQGVVAPPPGWRVQVLWRSVRASPYACPQYLQYSLMPLAFVEGGFSMPNPDGFV